jgi:thiamine pyrophosphate-dependent acetolactate synthase large subunit-like protein
MTSRDGRFAIIEQLLADDIHYMFGNPGTVEEGFLDALKDYPDFQYIFALQETIAVGMADGYARATKRPTVVQLHSGVGLGNGIGMIYQAMRGHAPLVVLAGEAGVQYDAMDAQMASDLVSMARPVTKWSTRVVDAASLLRVLRRAIKIAATPPMGPVFVSLPMDVLDVPNDEPIVPTSIPNTKVVPADDRDLSLAAEWLSQATQPMLIVGDGVAASDGQAELTRVAEVLGAQVFGADSSEPNMSAAHPLFGGLLGHMFGFSSQRLTQQPDVVLIVGTYVFPEVFPALSDVFAPGAKVIHIDLNTYEIAKNFPVDLGLLGDPKATLAKLARLLESTMTPEQTAIANERVVQLTEAHKRALSQQLEADNAVRDAVPLHMSRFAQDLAIEFPQDGIVFDEALTNSPELCRYLVPTTVGHYFQTRGGSLGVGIPGAIGAKLANPDRAVIGFTGDGGSMYTIQALWTAAHHNIDAKFVVCNNQSYRILKLNILQYWQEQGIPEHDFPEAFDIHQPEIRFADLAAALGVAAVRVEQPEHIGPAIQKALHHEGPFLIDLVLAKDVPSSKIGVKCGQ